MADFMEVLSQLRGWGGEGQPDEKLFSELETEYNNMETQVAGSANLITEKDAAIQEKDSRIQQLQSENYLLSVRASAASDGPDPNSGENNNESTPTPGIAGLFERKKTLR